MKKCGVRNSKVRVIALFKEYNNHTFDLSQPVLVEKVTIRKRGLSPTQISVI